jgi:tartrate-resistant acid phosphatase type 5
MYREFSHVVKSRVVGVHSPAMTRVLPCLCGALTILVACTGDDNPATASQSQGDPSTGQTTADPPVTTGGPTPAGSVSEDPDTGSASASQGTTAGPTTTTAPDPTSEGGPSTTTPDPPDTTTTTTAPPGTSGEDSTTGPLETGMVRFVAIGDTGEGNENQYMVADAIVAVCADKGGCDFGLMLGDNFYDSGVESVDDVQWVEKFEMVYADITFPLYASLGNHDYGGGGIGVDFDTDKPDYQVEYTAQSEIWRMPNEYYSFKQQHAEFFALDTNQVMTDPINGSIAPQTDWLADGLAASTATWKIAFGHHPYLSNGEHGNAGNYEDLEFIPFDFVNGENIKDFVEESLCGKVDVFISGHDHCLQWLEPTCGTQFIVSGAGSKSGPLPGSNPAFFGAAETEGFFLVELSDNSFTGTFYDKTGAELFTKTIMK